jgi:tight adherence protein C
MIALLLLFLAAVLVCSLFVRTHHNELVNRLNFRQLVKQPASKTKKFDEVRVLLEIPDFASVLWFALSAGESLDRSLRIAVSRGNGFVSSEFEKLIQRVDLGSLMQHELENLAAESKSGQIRELAAKLAVALVNGTPMADLLAEFVQSTNSEVRAILLAKAGKNETKMMIPMVFVILPVTVMFAMYPSLALIQNSFI